MHTRKVGELRAAIEAAEGSSLYDIELAAARRALEMERRSRAFARFADAKMLRDIPAMLAAIQEGSEFGLGAEELAAVEAEARRSAARERILELSAPGSGARREAFEAAMLEAEAAGLDGPELEIARAAIAAEEARAAARETLARAVKARDPRALRAALDLGSSQGLQEMELFEAQRALDEEQRRLAARSQLKDALLKKVIDKREQVEMLGAAIDEAAQAGVRATDVERARWHFDREERLLRARESVGRAVKSGKYDELLAAWHEALEAGLGQDEIEEVRRLLEDSKKPAAIERLKVAVASRDVQGLKDAIAYAAEVGLSEVVLGEAKSTLFMEEKKVEGRVRLAGLVGEGPMSDDCELLYSFPRRCTLEELRAALKFGEVVGLERDELRRARRIAEAEERRLRARRSLAELRREAGAQAPPQAEGTADADAAEVRRRLVEQLEAALLQSEEAGLAATETAEARALLQQQLQDAAREHLAAAMGRLGKDDAAIGKTHVAIFHGRLVGLPGEELARAAEAVALEERKRAARLALAEALAARDLVRLRAALVEGEAAGLLYPELRPGRDFLTLEAKRDECKTAIQAVLSAFAEQPPVDREGRRKLADRCQALLKQAAAAKLDAAVSGGIRDVLDDQEQKLAAAECISQAELAGDIRSLQEAMQAGLQAGLFEAELAEARARLAQLLLERAEGLLAAAVASRRLEDLRRALKAGEAAGLDDAALAAAREVYADEYLQYSIRHAVVHDLQRAIAFAGRWHAAAAELPRAAELLTLEQRKEAARAALKAVLCPPGSPDAAWITELLAAIREGQSSGLQDWEMGPARKVLADHRRLVA